MGPSPTLMIGAAGLTHYSFRGESVEGAQPTAPLDLHSTTLNLKPFPFALKKYEQYVAVPSHHSLTR